MATTRARILAEATRQLARDGLPAFTIASVRDALGLSSGSMFHAFASKAALAAAVYVEGMADYQRAVLAALGASAHSEGSLAAMIDAHLGWVTDNAELSRFLFSTLPDDVAAEAAPGLAEYNEAFYGTLERFYAGLTHAGLMGPLDARVAHAICVGPAQEYCRQWTRGNVRASPRELSATFQAVALAAIHSATPPKTPT